LHLEFFNFECHDLKKYIRKNAMNKKISSFFIFLLAIFLICTQSSYAQKATCNQYCTANPGKEEGAAWYCSTADETSCTQTCATYGALFTGQWMNQFSNIGDACISNCCSNQSTQSMCGCYVPPPCLAGQECCSDGICCEIGTCGTCSGQPCFYSPERARSPLNIEGIKKFPR